MHCGFFFIRLSWTGSGLQANMIEEYVLWCVFALLLYFLSCPSCLWRPRLFVSVASRHMMCIVLDVMDDAFDSRPALCLFSFCREEYSAALVSTTALVCLGCFAGIDAPRAMFPFTGQCLVPSGTCYASVLGWLLEEFHDFLREGVHSAPEVDSRALAGVFNAPDHFFTAPCFWQPLVRCSAEEYRIIFSASWFVSGYMH